MKKFIQNFFGLLMLVAIAVPASAQYAKKAIGAAPTSGISVRQVAKPAVKGAFKPMMTKAQAKAQAKRSPFAEAKRQLPRRNAGKTALKAPFRADLAPVSFYGVPVYSTAWEGLSNVPYGIYSFSSNSPMLTLEQAIANFAVQTACMSGGKIYAVISGGIPSWGLGFYHTYCYDAETYELENSNETTQMGDNTNCIFAMADGGDGTIYAYGTNDGETLQFGTFDPATMSFVGTATVETYPNGFAADKDGNLYGITADGTFVAVDKATGALTEIANFPEAATQYLTSGTIDPKTGIFYYMPNTDAESYMLAIDIDNKTCQKTVDFANGEEICGIWLPYFAGSEQAPAAATNVNFSFNEADLTAHVTFDAPTTTYDGVPATGEVAYKILANDTELANGTTTYGATGVAVDVTVPESGLYKFAVVMTNAEGDGPKTRTTSWVGYDELKPVENVALAYDEAAKQLTLTWDAATTAVHGGYIDAAAITYDVLENGEKVAEGLTETTWTTAFDPEVQTTKKYSVVANHHGFTTEPTTSNGITAGEVGIPYYNSFTEAGCLEGFTLITTTSEWAPADDYGIRMRYDSSSAMDSWAITPGLTVEKGKSYAVKLESAAYGSGYPERIEVKAGFAATADAMTQQVVEPTVIAVSASSDPYVQLEGVVKASQDGKLYIGIHGISDKDQFYLYARNLSVTAIDLGTPDQAKLYVTTYANGADKAGIRVIAPAKDLGGNDLAQLDKLEVMRDGEVIKSFANPQPGYEFSFVDEGVPAGDHTYSAVATNSHGASKPANRPAFIGFATPAAPENAAVAETSVPGQVTISWDAPTTDANGNEMKLATITYDITDGENTIAENIEATSYTYQAVPEGEQDFVQYIVVAKTEGGESDMAYTDMIPAGTPYTTPYYDNFADGSLDHILGLTRVEGNMGVSLATDESFADITSQDGDNGFIVFKGSALEDDTYIMSGKITVQEGNKLSFWRMPVAADDLNEVYAGVIVDGQMTKLMPNTDGEGNTEWTQYSIDLSAYAGKTVQYFIGAVTKMYIYTIIDNISVATPVDNDLAAASIYVPKTAKAGADYQVSVDVRNDGALAADGYTVELYKDGKLEATQAGQAIEPAAKANFKFTQNQNATVASATYKAKVVFAADENEANNETKEATVAITAPKYPTPTELTANAEGAKVKLAWTEPNLGEDAAMEMTDDLEDYDSWAIDEAGDWGFIDGDGAETYVFNGLDFPGAGSPMAFIVGDASTEGFDQAIGFAAHSGNKSFASFASTVAPNDDWLISPALCGDAQAISFWAKTYTDQYGKESFELWTSTTGTDRADFTLFEEQDDNSAAVPTEWTEFTYNLPAGTKYFAIRCTSNDQFIFMVDDITYTAGNPFADLSLAGYNVYRNGEKVNAETVAEMEYTDEVAETGEYTYVVTAVYTEGESKPSNAAVVSVASLAGSADGINGIATKAAKVTTSKNTILVQGAAGQKVVIVSADGKTIFNGNGAAIMSLRAAQGVYMVNINGKVAKVLVK